MTLDDIIKKLRNNEITRVRAISLLQTHCWYTLDQALDIIDAVEARTA